MLLADKVAVIHGGGGAVGGTVARAFAREGAQVFLTGRTADKLEKVAADIAEAGGSAETAQVDALDADAVEAHADDVVRRAGRFDIVLNAVGQDLADFGIPLTELSPERFAQPIATLTRTHFLTATAAARHMASRGSGVILTLSASVARMPDAMPGGLLIACLAIEALTRQLAVELGPKGVRAVCLRPDGMTETARMGSVTEPVWRRAIERTGGSFEEYLDAPDPYRVLPDPVRLADVAATALFMASDGAAAITGTVVNIAAGKFLDQA